MGMQAALAFLLLASSARAQAPAHMKAQEEEAGAVVRVLREGRWRLSVSGAICNACTRAMVEAVSRLNGVTAAAYDFEQGTLALTVARGKQVRAAQVERLLRDAARRVDLEVRFVLTETRYEGVLNEPAKPAPSAAPAPKETPAPKPQLPPADFPEPAP